MWHVIYMFLLFNVYIHMLTNIKLNFLLLILAITEFPKINEKMIKVFCNFAV